MRRTKLLQPELRLVCTVAFSFFLSTLFSIARVLRRPCVWTNEFPRWTTMTKERQRFFPEKRSARTPLWEIAIVDVQGHAVHSIRLKDTFQLFYTQSLSKASWSDSRAFLGWSMFHLIQLHSYCEDDLFLRRLKTIRLGSLACLLPFFLFWSWIDCI